MNYHRKRKYRTTGKVDLNLAAMLDMAFQLLAFFILTFRPAPVEGHLRMHLPPPIPIISCDFGRVIDVFDDKDFGDLEKLDISIESNGQGEVTLVKVGRRPIVRGHLTLEAIKTLKRTLHEIFLVQAIPFDRIQVVADDRLHYEELMKVIDVCTQQTLPDGKKMQRISFISASK